MKPDQYQHVSAALGVLFLILVFGISYQYLRNVRTRWNERGRVDAQKQLTPEERHELEQRMARQRERARRAEQEERRKDALNMAKPTNLYQEKLALREQARLDEERTQRLKAEQRKKHYDEEYAKWKSAISVEGSQESTHTLSVNEFVDFAKEQKLIDLETLGNKFHLTVPEVVHRLQELELQGVIYGIIDDRSKFCSIEPHEIQQVDQILKLSTRRLSLNETQALLSGTILRRSNKC